MFAVLTYLLITSLRSQSFRFLKDDIFLVTKNPLSVHFLKDNIFSVTKNPLSAHNAFVSSKTTSSWKLRIPSPLTMPSFPQRQHLLDNFESSLCSFPQRRHLVSSLFAQHQGQRVSSVPVWSIIYIFYFFL